MKVIFEFQGRVKMAEKWMHKNVNISPKKIVTCKNFFKNINKKNIFVTEEKVSKC